MNKPLKNSEPSSELDPLVPNPNYTLDPEKRFDGTPKEVLFRSVHRSQLTPEFLVDECIRRGWTEIHGRIKHLTKTETGYSAEVFQYGAWFKCEVPYERLHGTTVPGGGPEGSDGLDRPVQE